MREPRNTRLPRRLTALATACVLLLTAALASGSNQTAPTTVTLTAGSHIDLNTTSCSMSPGGGANLGTLLADTTRTSPVDCSIAFGSTNNTAKLLAYQEDGQGSAAFQPTQGQLDTSFSGDGTTTLSFGAGNDVAAAVAVQADGKYLVAGEADIGPDQAMALARFNTDGTLDTATFSTGDGTNGYLTLNPSATDDRAIDIAIQPDGKIIIAGSTDMATVILGDMVVARYTTAGVLDTATFSSGDGTDGYALISRGANTEAEAVIANPDGTILVGGTTTPGGAATSAIVRLTSTGSLDTTFSGDGWAEVVMGPNSQKFLDMDLDPSGNIVAGGWYSWSGGILVSTAIARFGANGEIDTTFSSDGWAVDLLGGISAIWAGVDVLEDGTIRATGHLSDGFNTHAFAARFSSDGTRDMSYAGDGLANTPTPAPNETVAAGKVLPDGSILTTGTSDASGDVEFGFARFTPTGNLDMDLDQDGLANIPITGGGTNDRAVDVELLPDGKVIAVGSADTGPDNDFALMRLDGEPVANYSDDAANLAGNDWQTPAAGLFGACLRSYAGGAGVNDVWNTDAGNNCGTNDLAGGDTWYPIAATSGGATAKIAETTINGTTGAQVDLRFGVRTTADQPPGNYTAPIIFEAVAPNA